MTAGRQPRVNVSIWAGHGPYVLNIWNNIDNPGALASYLAANKTEIGNLFGAIVQGFRDAGIDPANPPVAVAPVAFPTDPATSTANQLRGKMNPGTTYFVTGNGNNRVSLASGNRTVYVSTDPAFASNVVTGTGATPYLSVTGSWTVYMKTDDPDVQLGIVDIV